MSDMFDTSYTIKPLSVETKRYLSSVVVKLNA